MTLTRRRSLAVFASAVLPHGARADALEALDPTIPTHAIAMYGMPALPPGFEHFPYIDPAAPKGGRLAVGFEGTFDSLNPFNLFAGSTAEGLAGTVFQTLMTRSRDEPFTLYGLVAEAIETNAERSFVRFHLDPRARFSDGTPITSADILFTFDLLKARGRPQQRVAYGSVRAISAPDAVRVDCDLGGSHDRELPLILALMPVLPKHAVDLAAFDRSSLAPPLGSGPYKVAGVRPGLRLRLERDPAYWGRDLPSQRGVYNFETIDIEYFRDANAMFEAFEVGLLDARIETDPQRWTAAYTFPAAAKGDIVKETLPIGGPKGLEGFVFNLRRPVFAEVRVREALTMVFDFEWLNAKLFGGLYTRTDSFFAESDLSSAGRPASAAERQLLARWPGSVTPDIMDGRPVLLATDASGTDRSGARRALTLLEGLGYRLAGGDLTKDGRPLRFEILVRDRMQETLALNFAATIARIGVRAEVRRVDDTQYERRRQTFDYDMIIGRWTTSASPGNEQRMRWGSASVDQESSFNFAGAQNPAIDGLIEAIVSARSREDFVTTVRAYDRVLRSGFYAVPLFHAGEEWIAFKRGLAHPASLPHYDLPASATLDTWFWSRGA